MGNPPPYRDSNAIPCGCKLVRAGRMRKEISKLVGSHIHVAEVNDDVVADIALDDGSRDCSH